MSNKILRLFSMLLVSVIVVASLFACDTQSQNFPNRESETEANTAETQTESRSPHSDETETSDKSDNTVESDGSDTTEEPTTDTLDGSTEGDTESDTDNPVSDSENEDTAESTETVETSERFDYFAADMRDYVEVDKSLYINFSAPLPDYLDGSDGAVIKYIDLLRENNSTSTGNKIVDRAIQIGDTVALYYEGWLNGEKFAGGSNMEDTQPYMLKIGSGAFIPGFEEALIGIVPSETSKDNLRDLHLTFPENYHSTDLAGKAVIFKVYVEYIDELAPAPYTEDFITKTLGYTTTATDVKADFERYLKEELLPEMRRNEIMTAVWDNLILGATVKSYPQSELDYFYDSYIDQYEYYKQYYEYFGMKFNSFDEFVIAYLGLDKGADWKAVILDDCKRDVAQNLIFHAIAQQEEITVSDEDYKNAVKYYVNYYASQGQTVTAEQVEKELGARMINEQALWTNVNDFLVDCFVPSSK